MGAKRRQALSVLPVSIHASPSHFIRRSLQILVRNFYVGNTGNLRNFYVEIASGYCQWNSVLGPIGQTDSAIVHGTGGVRTHILTVLLNIVRTGHRNGHRNVSQSENKQQSA